VAVNGAVVLSLRDPICEVGRQAQARGDARALAQLRQPRADRRTGGPGADDVERERFALGVGPGAARVLLPALALENLLALLRIELERVGLREQILRGADVGPESGIVGKRKRRGHRGAEIAHVDDLLAVDKVAERPANVLV